jgi:endonuclease/exonuclease/phosphatase family metal-dependent hydrolase
MLPVVHKSPITAALALYVATICAVASGQIRVVTYNMQSDTGGFTTPRPGFDTVLQGIGNEIVNAFARPLDILTLQETTSNATTVTPIVNSLNNFYGAGTYAMSPYQGTQNGDPTGGNGPNALVYNTHTLQLIASVGIGTPSSSGPPRQPIRYQFRPVGYGPEADFYVYTSHLKSASDATSEGRRNAEAILLRGNANTLPAASRILYSGDFNLFKGSQEPAWITLTGTGSFGTNGRAVDPINLGNGSWDGSISAFRGAYTDSSTSLMFRDDLIFTTAPTMDGHGFSYITGSHHALGNNGSTPLGAPANSGSNTALPGLPNRSTVLNSLTTASDHYPVVADFRLPAKLGVAVGSVASQVIVGATLPVNITVTNVAPVSVAAGADGLDYSYSGSGAVTGAGSASNLAALATGNNHALAVNTATPGIKSGAVNVNSSSQEVANGVFTQNVSTTVLAHANGSLAPGSDQDALTIDFGIRARGSSVPVQNFAVYNLADASGFTAGLDLDSINASGSLARLSANVATFTNLAGGGSTSFGASLDTSAVGSLSTSYTLNLSDQDLLGATTLAPLTVNLSARVAIAGDANLDDSVSLLDFNILAGNFGLGTGATWQLGDFNGDQLVNLLDFNLLAANFGLSAGADGVVDPQDWAALASAVPEPGSCSLLILIAASFLRRRRPTRSVHH